MKHSKKLFGKTKIVCTLGPASGSPLVISRMIRSGMDAARLNFSHGTHNEHLQSLRKLRQASRLLGVHLSVIQDLQGPKIRIGELSAGPVQLRRGETITITTEKAKGDLKTFSTTYKDFARDVKKGDRVLIDDGKIQLKATGASKNSVTLAVVTGGVLSSHKGINLPHVAVSAPSVTEKDKEDLLFAFKHDVDYVALSFVRRGDDIAGLREFIVKNAPSGRRIPIIAKIEKAEAITNINEILTETDAAMVARGDLGVELPAEDVPLLQKMIVRKCNERGKPVIIATQMLESMLHSPTPTRAEASDVANAVLDGADAVMLSGETAVGEYPVDAVRIMDRIISKTENHGYSSFDPERLPLTHHYDPLSLAACRLASDLKASLIVVLTHSGLTAARVAKFRPAARIVAVTDSEKIMRRLNLVWGITGLIVEDLKKDTDATFGKIEERLLSDGYARAWETVLMVAGIPLFEGRPTNVIKVEKVQPQKSPRKRH